MPKRILHRCHNKLFIKLVQENDI